MIRLAVAEDNSFLADSIREKCSFFNDLKLKFIGVNGVDLLEKLAEDSNIDVILMDIQMPEMNGIETTRNVKKKYPQIKVVMLTVFDDEENIFDAIQAGADGYLLKDESAMVLHQGLLEITNGGAPMSPAIALKTLKLLRSPLPTNTSNSDQETFELSAREINVLEQLSEGLNYKEIAANLLISAGTVRKHIENTYKKLHVHNKVEALKVAQRARII